MTRAFDPFYTTKPLKQGTGLGLSIVHGSARQSGGQVRYAASARKGTTMCIYLPHAVGELDTTELIDADPSTQRVRHETVLVSTMTRQSGC
ncbi:ATP-binding protein [Caballeronia sp. M23-90]